MSTIEDSIKNEEWWDVKKLLESSNITSFVIRNILLSAPYHIVKLLIKKVKENRLEDIFNDIITKTNFYRNGKVVSYFIRNGILLNFDSQSIENIMKAYCTLLGTIRNYSDCNEYEKNVLKPVLELKNSTNSKLQYVGNNITKEFINFLLETSSFTLFNLNYSNYCLLRDYGFIPNETVETIIHELNYKLVRDIISNDSSINKSIMLKNMLENYRDYYIDNVVIELLDYGASFEGIVLNKQYETTVSLVKLLIERGYEFSEQDSVGYILYCISNKDMDYLVSLLSNGLEKNKIDVIIKYVIMKDPDILRLIFEYYSPNDYFQCYSFREPFYKINDEEKLMEITKILIEYGLSSEKSLILMDLFSGRCPKIFILLDETYHNRPDNINFLYNSIYTRSIAFVKYLLENFSFNSGKLSRALINMLHQHQHYSLQDIKLLLDYGAPVTCLHVNVAVAEGLLDALKLFFETGINMDKGKEYLSEIYYYLKVGSEDSALEFIKLLTDNGMELYNFIEVAAKFSSVAEYLFSHGLQPTSDLIRMATKIGNLSVIKLCVQYGVPVTDDVVMIACSTGDLDILKYFVEIGIDLSKDEYVNIAKDMGFDEVVELLSQNKVGLRG